MRSTQAVPELGSQISTFFAAGALNLRRIGAVDRDGLGHQRLHRVRVGRSAAAGNRGRYRCVIAHQSRAKNMIARLHVNANFFGLLMPGHRRRKRLRSEQIAIHQRVEFGRRGGFRRVSGEHHLHNVFGADIETMCSLRSAQFHAPDRTVAAPAFPLQRFRSKPTSANWKADLTSCWLFVKCVI